MFNSIDQIQAELETKVVIFGNAEPGQLVGRFQLIQKLLELLGGWQGLISGLDKEEVRKVVIDFYQAYIKPLDIPGVPFFVEGLVDNAIEALLNRIIDKLFDEVQAVS